MNSKNGNNAYGDPIVYKGVRIYPIKMRDALDFYNYTPCLTINKNTIPDPQIIKMSYLDFIIFASQREENKVLYENLINLLFLVFREQIFNIVVDKQTNKLIINIISDLKYINLYKELEEEYKELTKSNLKDENILQKLYDNRNTLNSLISNNIITLNGKDFDNIRKIILRQNLIKFDDDLVNAEVKKALDEAQEFINKKNKDKQATLDELIISYSCDICNGKPQDYEDIKDLTIFQFYKGLQRTSLSKQQMMLSTALGMGSIKSKDMPSWLDHVAENGVYDDVILSEDSQSELKSIGNKIK